MIVILKENTTAEARSQLIAWFRAHDIDAKVTQGIHTTILGLVGDTASLDIDRMRSSPWEAG